MNKPTTKLTVAIPVYNGYPYIKTCVDSLLNQTLKNFKILIINDASTDKTTNYLEELHKKYPEISIIHQENKGIGETRNCILKLIETEYYANLDADDYNYPNRLEQQLDFMENNQEIGACGCFIEYFNQNSENSGYAPYLPKTHEQIVKKLVHIQHGITFPTLMIRTDLAKKTGGFIFSGIGEDWDFMLKLSKLSKLANIDKKLYKMRVHSTSVSYNNWGECRLKNQYAVYSYLNPNKNLSFADFKKTLFNSFSKKLNWKILTYTSTKFIKLYRKGIIFGLAGKKISSWIYFILASIFAPHKAITRVKNIVLKIFK